MRNIKCRSCVNYRNNWCHQIADDPAPDLLRDCQYYREKTNADHIRSMSDEKLAKFLEVVGYDMMDARAAIWLNWLKQPYKEEA